MKSLVCALNTKFVHSSLAPWCLKAGVRKYAPETECAVLEGTINESEQSILARIMEKEFEIIGFCTYIWNVQLVLSLCEKIKAKRNVKIVLGGPEVSYNAKEILEKHPFVDYVISGEGEEPFGRLCGDKSIESIDGLCYRSNGEIVIKEPHIATAPPPSPYTEEYFESLNGRISYLETSRGCPYRCAFCLSGRCGGVRFFDIEEAKKNIVLLSQSGSKTIKFVDRTFNANSARAKEIFNFIIDNYGKKIPSGVCFHFEIEGSILDEETISILSRAETGSIQLEIGIQTFNPQALKSINRVNRHEILCDNIKKLLFPGNIHIHIDLIAGLPYEDLSSFAQSFNKAIALKPHMLQFGFLKLLHGSDLKEKVSEHLCTYDKTPPYEIKSTKWLSFEDLALMHITEDALERLYNSGRFSRTVSYLTEIFENQFEMYTSLGKFVQKNEKSKSLDEFSSLVFQYFSSFEGIDKCKLRDCMAIDRLATNRMGTLPEFLKHRTNEIKRLLTELEADPSTRRKKGVKRALTVLSAENSYVYVDYHNKNSVTKEYTVTKRNIFI